MKKPQQVVVLGASPKPERYANQAVRELINHGHYVYPIHPRCTEIYGQKCYPHLKEIVGKIDTLTLYVGEAKSSQLIKDILLMKPQRIIMNPGAENDLLETQATANNIEVIRACTLVMLRMNLF